MNLESDLARLALQEQRLVCAGFDEGSAWELGMRIKALCDARRVAVAMEVRLAKETIFYYAMPGTSPNNADWVRRKRNTVELLHRSSYSVGLGYQKDGGSMEQKLGVPTRDFACHGGAFPIRVRGVGCVGVVTVSGVPQREDHAIVVQAMAELCGVALAEVALDA